jgi:GT2 family glycosyltransferase/tetratricopeptide (TPR) repeat protein/SAM-dependent methyltransferase
MADVTVILTAYRRPDALRGQVEAIRAQSLGPRAIWLWANEPGPPMLEAIDGAEVDRVVVSNVNAYVHARFALALTAPTEFVALFDDDTVPGAGWLANCVETFGRSPGILGSAGVRLHGEEYSSRSVHGWHDPSDETTEVDLVGHAWFLRTAWVHHLFSAPAVTGTNGEDIELAARAWKSAGVRCFCPPHPPRDRSLWGSLRGAELGSDQVALSRRPAHLAERDRIVRAEIAAGWRPLFRRGTSPAAGAIAANEDGRRIDSGPRIAPPPRDDTPAVPVADASPIGVAPDADAWPTAADLPPSAQRILVIGSDLAGSCRGLRTGRDCKVTAIERDPAAVERTRAEADECHPWGQEDDPPELPDGSYDAVLCGDLLERVRRPGPLLARLRRWLVPDGRLFADVGNARRHATVEGLLGGRWAAADPSESGPRPIRFYTRREIEKLLHRAGFAIGAIRLAPGPGHAEWREDGRPGEVRVGRLRIGGLSPEDAEEFYADRLRVEAIPETRPERRLTSIVILTHDQLEYTRQCLDSIRRYTDEPYELIVVDNASFDGTLDYLRAQPDVRLIANDENRGFPAAANQGIEAARGGQVLLLNNDTVVTTGWLGRMLRAFDDDPDVGLVGPCSNYVGSEQQVPVSYEDVSELDGFAWDRGKRHDRLVEDSDRLVGFCLLIRREVIDAIGGLDERFGVGCFEDDDYCRRALGAGFRAVITRDSFVHHYGGRTFVGSGVDFAAVMRENEAKYRRKWEAEERPKPALAPGRPGRDGGAESSYTVVMAPGGGLLLQRREVRLSLCMIVRDSSRTLPACLESIRPWVDEMVVVDTGSTDDTVDIIRRFGGRPYHFPWCDCFSTARNESLRHARGRWLFWMDSDDTITPECGRKLRELAYSECDPSILGFVVQVHCPGEDGDLDVTAVDHVKLIRNRPELRFEGRIHEQILPAIRREGGEVAWTDLYVVHSGSDRSEEAQERKRARDLRLLELELAERPEHPFTLFNLGMTHADGGDHGPAAAFLERSIGRSGEGDSHLRKAYALLAYARMQLKQTEAAHAACRAGLASFPEDAELRFREGVVLHELGRYEEAERAYLDVLSVHEPRHFTSVDRGLKGFKANQNLAVVYADMGDLARAERQWRQVVREVPSYRAGWRGLGEVLLRRGKLDEAGAVAEELCRAGTVPEEGRLLRGRVAAARGDLASARRELEAAAGERPEDPEPLRALGQLLFEHGRPEEAEGALRELTRRDPADAAAHHNLGTLYLRAHRFREATAAYRESLRLRPGSAVTWLQLGYALKEGGRLHEAVTAWEETLRLSPDDPSAREELRWAERRGLATAGPTRQDG